jgi:hypothetical protein
MTSSNHPERERDVITIMRSIYALCAQNAEKKDRSQKIETTYSDCFAVFLFTSSDDSRNKRTSFSEGFLKNPYRIIIHNKTDISHLILHNTTTIYNIYCDISHLILHNTTTIHNIYCDISHSLLCNTTTIHNIYCDISHSILCNTTTIHNIYCDDVY